MRPFFALGKVIEILAHIAVIIDVTLHVWKL
jgi:hypothetical protein